MRVHMHRLVLALVTGSYIMQTTHLTSQPQQHPQQSLTSFQFTLYLLISVFLSCFAGICSGLTVGYMSISKSEMELWMESDNEKQRELAKPILQILNNHHLLLSTLLLANALALEALPIFLDKIVPPYLAILISSAAVVIFGEVIPQAYCTGPHKVTIGYYMSPFLRLLQCILYPFVKPIVYILDNWLGHHEGKITLTRENLKNILLLHNKMEYGYRPEEVEILQNILDLKTVSIDLVMIPLEKVFMLEANSKVNESLVDDLIKCNFSKIPIYEGQRDKVIGYIKVKNLMEFNMKEEKSLAQGEVITKVVEIHHKLNLLDAIDILKNNRINFAVILDDSKKCKGIVTLKQIFEKIVLKEFDDNDKRVLIEWGGSGPKVQNLMEAKQQQ